MPVFRILFTLCCCASLALGAELQTVAGKTIKGELVSLTDKEIVLRSEAGEVKVPADDVLQLDLQPAQAIPAGMKYTLVELTDGSQLQCSQVTIKGKQVELTLLTADPAGKGPVLQLPLRTLSYLLKDAQDAELRKEWAAEFLGKRGNEDAVAIRREDALNRLNGILGDGTDDGKIEFQRSGQTDKLLAPMANLQGLLFARRPNADAPPIVCKVQDLYRNTLVASKIEVGDKGYTITTVAGAKLEYAKTLIARFDYSKGKFTYLSELKPVNPDPAKSNTGWIDPPRPDRNLEGDPIRLAGQTYPRGLTVHAFTELVYELEGHYNEFKFILGVDDAVRTASRVQVRIDGDGRELFVGAVNHGDKPRPMVLDVKNVRRLRIVVRSAGLFDSGNQVVLANAQLSK